MEKDSMIIKNTHILSPADGLDAMGDIYIRDGVIERIAEAGGTGAAEPPAGYQQIDAADAYAVPGFVDVHAHFRDPGQTEKEDLHSGALAASAGGYTTVVCMANTTPPVDNPETLKDILERASGEPVHIFQCAAVTEGRAGKRLTDFSALMEAGAIGFTDDGSPITDAALTEDAMRKAAEFNAVLSFHEEDPDFIGTAGINEGAVSKEMGLKGADREAEIRMVKRDLALAMKTGCRIDIQHVSAKETVELIREAKQRDKKNLIHAEVTPNHFSLTEDAVRKHLSLAKINPPLREEADRQAIIEGLKDGTIDMIATDHAPHTKADKGRAFKDCMSGIIGLETAFSLGIKSLVKPGVLTLKELITLMSVNPAGLYGLNAGHIRVGSPADIAVVSISEDTLYDSFKSKADNSPFLGERLPGRILHTIAGGRKVY